MMYHIQYACLLCICFFLLSSFTKAEDFLSQKQALDISFKSAEITIDGYNQSTNTLLQIAKDRNIISKNSTWKICWEWTPNESCYARQNISFVEFLKISLKSHGFVDKNNCALRGNQWYTPFLDIALSHEILSEIPNEGKLSGPITQSEAEKILSKIKAKKTVLNNCTERKKQISQSVNFRQDAGIFGKNIWQKIPAGAEVIKIGNPVLGKNIWYNGKNQNQWQAIEYNGNIGFVLPEFLSDDIVKEKFIEKLERSFSLFTLDGSYKLQCSNTYVQKLKNYQVKGERKKFEGGMLVYKKGKGVFFIRSELSNFYAKYGGSCGSIGFPIDSAKRFGDSPSSLKKNFLSEYQNFKKWRKGFQSSRIGWSQKFSSGKTLYTPNASDAVYFFVTNRSNCVFDMSQEQICCESPRGKMCHDAVSGGGNRFNGHSRTNNSDWQWHHTLLKNTWDVAGPIPLGEYNMQYAGGACKFRSPFLHFTCISYLLHKGNSSRINPPAGAKKPNGEKADYREELFFHPAFASAGCITFTDQLQPWDNASNWEKEIPKWKEVVRILDGGPIYGRGYMGGGFIGKMVVTE